MRYHARLYVQNLGLYLLKYGDKLDKYNNPYYNDHILKNGQIYEKEVKLCQKNIVIKNVNTSERS